MITKKFIFNVFYFIVLSLSFSEYGFAAEIVEQEQYGDSPDLTLINDSKYDLSRSFFGYKPTLGRGLRDQLNSSGGSACTSCSH